MPDARMRLSRPEAAESYRSSCPPAIRSAPFPQAHPIAPRAVPDAREEEGERVQPAGYGQHSQQIWGLFQ